MKNSLGKYVGTLFDVPIFIHWSAGLLPTIISIRYLLQLDFIGIFTVFAIYITAFFFVFLHEFGHVLIAKKYGVKTHSVVMHVFGGVANMYIPPGGYRELHIAIAGPCVNFAIAGICSLLMMVFNIPFISSIEWSLGSILSGIFTLNAFIGLFNLIPLFPMDGGRILRSILMIKFNEQKTNTILKNTSLIIFGFLIFAHFYWNILSLVSLVLLFFVIVLPGYLLIEKVKI